jgi:putative acetyltransferase
MQIRRADPTDANVLSTIRQQAIRRLAVPTLSVEQAEAWATGVTSDRVPRAIQEQAVWVAEDVCVIGWIAVDHDRIAALYVLPSAAHQGVGSLLLLHAEATISSAGYRAVYLDASQNALGFYLRRGYTQSGAQTADGAWPLTKKMQRGADE